MYNYYQKSLAFNKFNNIFQIDTYLRALKLINYFKRNFSADQFGLISSSFLVTANEQLDNDMDYMNGSSQGFTLIAIATQIFWNN